MPRDQFWGRLVGVKGLLSLAVIFGWACETSRPYACGARSNETRCSIRMISSFYARSRWRLLVLVAASPWSRPYGPVPDREAASWHSTTRYAHGFFVDQRVGGSNFAGTFQRGVLSGTRT